MGPCGVIIGGGLAGISTAYHLSVAGVTDLTILEQAEAVGQYASGRNAAMARQYVPERDTVPLAVRGTRFLYDPPRDVSATPLIRATGSIIFFPEADEGRIAQQLRDGARHGLQSTLIRRAEWESRIPWLRGYDGSRAIWTPSDGVVDVHGLLHGLLRGATGRGVTVRLNTAVAQIATERDHFFITTTTGDIACDFVVNAAGAWSDAIASRAGLAPLGLRPLKRHLFILRESDATDATLPFIWDDRLGWYLRPESDGWLASPCDESLSDPCDWNEEHHARDLLARKFAQHLPALGDAHVQRGWAGLRTFTQDGRFHIAQDCQCQHFFWVAGLGGHGVTCAAAAGARAAEVICESLGCRRAA
jgi:D-arginine dehydrogenase